MNNYFNSVGSKALLKSKETFNYEDCRLDLLFKHYKDTSKLSAKDLVAIDELYKEWCDTLFSSYNIVVSGKQSKFRLLETFWARYLDSGKIPDMFTDCKQNGGTNLNIITVKLHGLITVSATNFNHTLFKITEQRYATEDDIRSFLDEARKKRIHYVFLIHSFELLYKKSKPVCDIIFQLFENEPKFIHILLSSDHVSSGRVLHTLKYRMQFVFYRSSYGESFLYEKTQTVCVMDDADQEFADEANAKLTNGLVGEQIKLQTLKDVHSALQRDCERVLIYIMEHFVNQTHLPHETAPRESERFGSAEVVEEKRVRKLRNSTKVSKTKAVLYMEELLEFYQKEFLVRRPVVLRGHLEELVDHKIIELDESGNEISCLLSVGICKKFLEYLNDERQ